jgi:cysteine synthase A
MDVKFKTLDELVGNTPLLEITLKYKKQLRIVYAKLEYYNYTGSIKDRIAYYILKKAYQSNIITPDHIIAEATSGNTGIAFSGIGKLLGHKVKIFMPEWMSEERKKLILSYGAELRLVTKEEGGFIGSAVLVDDEAKNDKYFTPHQFSNEQNVEAHCNTTAVEIERQILKFSKNLDAFVAGVGTGGTVMGVNRYFKQKNKDFQSFPVEPDTSAIMSGDKVLKEHKIQGIGDGFIPEIVKLDLLSQPIKINEDDSIIVAQNLSKVFGIGIGISSGCNLLATLKAQDIIGVNKTVATVFADDNKKYLSTDYSSLIPSKDGFMSNDIEFLDMKAVR